MKKPSNPRQLAIDLLPRSTRNVQVTAVIYDKHGIHGWGWNHEGEDGYGEHAEAMAISRANPHRLPHSSIVVVSQRRTNRGKVKKHPGSVTACPCANCKFLVAGLKEVWYRNKDGEFKREH